ncbi:hypothetical protein RE9416_24190 [Prescottella equi]|nr:hypothetical protein RE9416_24190 [Prescottella equi]
MIYTSGSTGRPKGVAVSHRAIVNRLAWMQDPYHLTGTDVVVQKTPATFDVSVWEFFWPLQNGASLAIALPEGHRDPAYLSQLIHDRGVTVAHFVPSMLAAFIVGADPVQCRSLRTVFCSGEALPPSTAEAFAEFVGPAGAELHNLYGPTEAAVDVTYRQYTAADTVSVPIGTPVWNTQVYVLDARLHPAPVGVPGELYLAGVQLARGYVGRPDLTAERFVANPFGAPGTRLYRTGDLVRWRKTGHLDYSLDYLGRTDFQVKLRGLRIELGEVEATLLSRPGVAQAVVVVRRDELVGEALVGYVIADPGVELEPAALREFLAESLPPYMVPSQILVLDEFPLGSTGKLDRRALPAPEFGSVEAEFVAPRGPVEEILALIFGELVGTTRIGVYDSFFDLGGNSLTATRLVARVNDALDAHIGVRDVFDAPTVAALALRIESGGMRGSERAPLEPAERPAAVPVSLAQKRMWFINQFDTSSAAYNVVLPVRLDGDLDRGALRAAVADVLDRHESLRTRFPMIDGEPVQVIVPTAAVAPDLEPESVAEQDVAERVAEFAGRGFDVTVAPPVRSLLLRVGPQTHVLVIVVHHICADGFSLAPLARDVMSAYIARTEDRAPHWTPLAVQYADYALWQQKVLGGTDDPDSVLSRQLSTGRAPSTDCRRSSICPPTGRGRRNVRSAARSRSSGSDPTCTVGSPPSPVPTTRPCSWRYTRRWQPYWPDWATPTTSRSAHRSRAAVRPPSTTWSACSSTHWCCGATSIPPPPTRSCSPRSATATSMRSTTPTCRSSASWMRWHRSVPPRTRRCSR